MLHIHDVMLDAITTMRPMVRDIERRDKDLASQLKRAASSVVLNVAEGSGSFGGMRRQRYRTALGSARETMSCLLVAERAGYVEGVPSALVAAMNRVIGTLVRGSARPRFQNRLSSSRDFGKIVNPAGSHHGRDHCS